MQRSCCMIKAWSKDPFQCWATARSGHLFSRNGLEFLRAMKDLIWKIPFTEAQCSVSICPLRAVIGMAPAAVTWWEVPLMWGNTNQKWGKCHKCVMKWFNALLMHFSLQLLGRFNNNMERGQLSSSANSWDETHLHIAPLQLHKILRF